MIAGGVEKKQIEEPASQTETDRQKHADRNNKLKQRQREADRQRHLDRETDRQRPNQLSFTHVINMDWFSRSETNARTTSQ